MFGLKQMAMVSVDVVATDYHTLDGATPLADAFISPLLQPHGLQGTWQRELRLWS